MMVDNSLKLELALRKSALLVLVFGSLFLFFIYTVYFEQVGLETSSYLKLAQCLLSGVLCAYLLISSWAKLWDAMGLQDKAVKGSTLILEFVFRKISAVIIFYFLCLRLSEPFGLLFCLAAGLAQLFATLYFCSRARA